MKDSQPLVTVYITNYNYGKYIDQSIKSVLNQTLQDFELLIIDDGSTDNSKDIIEKYADVKGISIIHQKNKGLNITNNIAMRTAKGQYFMRLDADDYLAPEALHTMAQELSSDPELGLVFPNYYYIDNKGHVTGKEIRHDFKKEVALFDNPAHGACTMIRLSFLKALGGYNESFTCQDGYDLWLKFITNHKVANVSAPLFYYRRHGNNLTSNENRILSTRKEIKKQFLQTNKLKKPATIALIPVRNTFINDTNWPLLQVNDKSIIESLIETVALNSIIDYVVVTTSDANISDYLQDKGLFNEKIKLIIRPSEYARVNEPLYKTFLYVIEQLTKQGIKPEAVMSVYPEYPFLDQSIIEEAINTLTIFKSDSLISVRPDNKMYYQHFGHGMMPILDQDKFTKLEREALYKGAGGIVITTVKNLLKNKQVIGGKVGHIVINRQEAFGVFDEFDLEVFKALTLKKEDFKPHKIT